MPVDFTFAAFDTLCQSIAAIPVFSVADYLATPPDPNTPYVILRFDVDYRESHAVRLAEIATRYGLRGSFYFRYRSGSFDLDAMRTIAGGHEIGYHFETLDTCQGDFDAAAQRFAAHIGLLRTAGFDISTAAAHGSTPTASTYRSNRDLLIKKPELLKQAGLIGETSLNVDFAQVRYLSDANWRWRFYEHFTPGARGTPTSLRAQLDRLPTQDRGLYINIHPQQWFEHPARMMILRMRNRFGKPIVPLLRHWHILKPDV